LAEAGDDLFDGQGEEGVDLGHLAGEEVVEVAAEAVDVEAGLGQGGKVDGLAHAVLDLVAAGLEAAFAGDGADEIGGRGLDRRAALDLVLQRNGDGDGAGDLGEGAGGLVQALGAGGLDVVGEDGGLGEAGGGLGLAVQPLGDAQADLGDAAEHAHALARGRLGRRGLGFLLGFRDRVEHGRVL
jgi:hypothetical protein